jgi:hypothetical protein
MRIAAILLVLAPLLFSSDLHAQTARNAAYFELGGSAIVPSINYERRLNERWFGRAGLSYVSGQSSNHFDRTFIVPLTLSSVSRPGGNHHLELGGGVTFAGGDRQELFESAGGDNGTFSTAFLTGIIGYRYQKPDGGFQFRSAFTPVAGGGDFLPWFGVSFGYAW